jgi:hypothetical protein
LQIAPIEAGLYPTIGAALQAAAMLEIKAQHAA